MARDRHILTGDRAIDDRGITGERIHLPRTITKTAASHDVPLTPLMRVVIAAQPRTISPLLFPSRITGGRLQGWHQLVATLRRDSGIDFGLHDLRRTCRTLMSVLGIAEDIAELAIGHQRADLVARYNKDQAWPDRIAAFEKVSAHISALLAEAADDCGTSFRCTVRGARRLRERLENRLAVLKPRDLPEHKYLCLSIAIEL